MIVLLGILILVPLGVALLLLAGALVGIATGKGGAEAVVAALIFGGLCAALIWAARRMLTRKGALLTAPGAEVVNPRLQRFLTFYVLFLVYVVLAGYAFVILHINSARNWLGAAFLVLAAGMLESAICALRRSRHAQREAASHSGRGLAMHGLPGDAIGPRLRDRLWPLVGAAGFSVSAVLYYRDWGGSHYLGPLDLAGFLGLALAFAIAVILRGIAWRRAMAVSDTKLQERQGPEDRGGDQPRA